ncbi:MAG: tripartite tricarboxylate transporter substrate-binding protein, partial [Hydrogenophaga sp.]|uniref:tripartite tricarboxylate transporter substrate-binding protein n=1 Tax=Hydrogenophaga sp. TaxID=1904254 RepID=UPI003D9BB80B
ESGVKNAGVQSWQAVAAPAGLPADIKKRVHEAIVSIIKEPATATKLTDLGFEIVLNTPEQFDAFQNAEFARWQKLITSRNIKAD